MKEQIEEMELTPRDILANDIYQHCQDLADNYCGDTHCVSCLSTALYNAGYRKQKEGRWVHKLTHSRSIPVSCDIICDQCCLSFYRFHGMNYKYCPNCGAKMKGGD